MSLTLSLFDHLVACIDGVLAVKLSSFGISFSYTYMIPAPVLSPVRSLDALFSCAPNVETLVLSRQESSSRPPTTPRVQVVAPARPPPEDDNDEDEDEDDKDDDGVSLWVEDSRPAAIHGTDVPVRQRQRQPARAQTEDLADEGPNRTKQRCLKSSCAVSPIAGM